MQDSTASPLPKLNLLVAIPYLTPDVAQVINESADCTHVLLDSGAFTAWKAKQEIELDYYIKFVKELPFAPWRYFTLDKIGDPEGTLQNYDKIRAAGLAPIPIFTRGDDPAVLERYYEHSDLVAIGGLVGTRNNKGFVRGIMERIGERKVHWLGFGRQSYLDYYRPYSCDSSSWAGAVRYGGLKLYLGQGRWITLKKSDFMTRPSQEIIEALEPYGEDVLRLSQKLEWTNSGRGDRLLELLTTKSWVRYSLDIERVLGVKYFLVCACGWHARLMLRAYEYWMTKLHGKDHGSLPHNKTVVSHQDVQVN